MKEKQLSPEESRKIVNMAVRRIRKQPKLTTRLAVEDAAVEIVPDIVVGNKLSISPMVLSALMVEIEAKVKGHPNPDESRLCLCGCGQTTNKGKNFKQGHDARFVRKVLAVEIDGEDPSTIPPESLKWLKGPQGKTLLAKIQKAIIRHQDKQGKQDPKTP